MKRYNIPFRGSRQPGLSGAVVPLGAAGAAWTRPGRHDRHWWPALAGTALVHVLCVVPALLISRTAPLAPSAETAVDMVFAAPSVTAPEPAGTAPQPTAVPPVPDQPQPAAEAQPAPAKPTPPAQPASIEQSQAIQPPDQPSAVSREPDKATPTEPNQPPAASEPRTVTPAEPSPPPPTPSAPQPPAPAQAAEPLPLPPPPPPSAPRPRPEAPRREIAHAVARPAAPSTALVAPAPDQSAAPEAAPAAPQAAPVSAAWRQALASWLAEHKTYPERARRSGVEGSVALRFSIDHSGRVADLTLLRGSGSPVLDAAAEAMLRDAQVPPPPTALQQITISVQIRYQLTD